MSVDLHMPFNMFSSQDTSDLALRIGLSSGPTTAGVLRGEKARFQLFGDVSKQVPFHSALDK
jgi:class 3 adenylate cyclase